MSTRSARPTASAPPDPPSPMTAVMIGVRSDAISIRLLAIAVQFHKIGEDGIDVIERIGAPGMAGDLDALHGGQIAVDLDPQLGQLVLERAYVLREICILPGNALQLLDLFFQLEQRFFKVQRICRHQAFTSVTPSVPKRSRSAANRSSAASTRNARLRRRTVLPFSSLSLLPFSPPSPPRSPRHSIKRGVGPGGAAHNAAIARAGSGWGRLAAVPRRAHPPPPPG